MIAGRRFTGRITAIYSIVIVGDVAVVVGACGGEEGECGGEGSGGNISESHRTYVKHKYR